jgi:hypothetical protein
MIELAETVKLIEPELLRGAMLPMGVIVGSAVIERVTPPDPSDTGALLHWHLADVKRAKKFRKPKAHPQPVWSEPRTTKQKRFSTASGKDWSTQTR